MRLVLNVALVALAIGCCWQASHARADEPEGPASKAADVLFREGKALLDAGKLDEACRVLDESNRLEAAGGTLLNLASCYERLGRYASAERALAEASRLAEAAGRDDAKRFIDERLAAVAPNVSLIRVKLTPQRLKAATTLEVDRERIELNGETVAVRLDPGDHEVRVESEGAPLWRRKVTIDGAGKVLDVEVESAPQPPPLVARKAPAVSAPGMSAFEVLGIVGLTTGGGLLLGGAIAGGLAIDAWSEASERCPNPTCGDKVGVERSADAAIFGNVSTGLVISGAVLAVAGGAFLVVSKLEPGGAKGAWAGPTTLRF